MFDPDVEARFKRIEDVHAVTAELLHRFEIRCEERLNRLEAIQDAMARWMEDMAARQENTEAKLNALVDAQLRGEAASEEMRRSIADLSRTVERFLKSRSDGGAG